MAVVMRAFVQEQLADGTEWKSVHGVAEHLLAHLNEPDAQQSLAVANMPGQSSALVQATFAEFARDLGFVDESRGLFESYENRALRPDYYLRVGDTGILLEVERGKTTINMDLLDFWKCHLCEHANYLFLMVPQELRQNATMSPRREFNTVVKRMASFFVPETTRTSGASAFSDTEPPLGPRSPAAVGSSSAAGGVGRVDGPGATGRVIASAVAPCAAGGPARSEVGNQA